MGMTDLCLYSVRLLKLLIASKNFHIGRIFIVEKTDLSVFAIISIFIGLDGDFGDVTMKSFRSESLIIEVVGDLFCTTDPGANISNQLLILFLEPLLNFLISNITTFSIHPSMIVNLIFNKDCFVI